MKKFEIEIIDVELNLGDLTPITIQAVLDDLDCELYPTPEIIKEWCESKGKLDREDIQLRGEVVQTDYQQDFEDYLLNDFNMVEAREFTEWFFKYKFNQK